MSTRTAPTLEMLREQKDEIVQTLRKYNAGNVRVFGSIARGEATPDSDIDLICDYDPDNMVGFYPVNAAQELESLLGYPVQILSPIVLEREYIGEMVGKDLVLL